MSGLLRFRSCTLAVLVTGACSGGSDDVPRVDARSRCETATHDEDGDGVVDVCDNCPTVPNADQADTTEVAVRAFADGVGDACDVRPALGGDTIGALFTWEDAAQSAAWTGDGWTIERDVLTTATTARWQILRGESGDGLAVVARLSAFGWQAPGGGQLAITIDGDGITSGLTCALRFGTNGEELVAHELGGAMQVVALAPPEPGDVRSLVAWRRVTIAEDSLECRIAVEGKPSQTVDAVVPLTDDLTIGAYAIAASGVTLDLSSVIVYSSPGPKDP